MEEWRLEKQKMVENFHVLNQSAVKGQTVFAGSSLMEMFPVEEWMKELGEDAPICYNRGVGGYCTTDMLPIMEECVLELEPSKVFINIGTNDLSKPEVTISQVMENYDRILTMIEERLPKVKIYLMAYYPINYDAAIEEMKPVLLIRNNEKINVANRQVEALAKKHHQKYIDVNAPLKDELGRLKAEYTIEGMHIRPEGYRAIFLDILEYVKE